MSVVPLMFRDWWTEDMDRPLSRLFDQHFGIGLRSDDLISPLSLRSSYYRPWRHLTRTSSGTSTIQADKEKFQVILDVQQFKPEEIEVKTVDNFVVIEGKHEEKPDEHGFITRHFVRRYQLPKEVVPENITSSLSSDGVLIVSAPRKQLEPPKPSERIVRIQQTGVPAATGTNASSPIGEKIVEVKQE